MKISIWQQFSSNHSSSYVVIGEFKTLAETENAAATMKQILKQIYDWYHDEANKTLAYNVRNTEKHPPTPAENQIATQYNVTFDYALDWIARQQDTRLIDIAVQTLDNHLFVAYSHEPTSIINTQFAQLIGKFCGKINYDKNMNAHLSVSVTCLATTAKAAETIATPIRTYLQRESNSVWQRPPWVLYCDGKLAEHPEQISAEVEIYIEHQRAMREWDAQNKIEMEQLYQTRLQASRNHDKDNAKLLNALIQEKRAEQKNIKPKLAPDREAVIYRILWRTSVEASDKSDLDTVLVENNCIKIRGLNLTDDVMIAHTLKAIIAWLEAQGCENVLYQFEVKKYS